MEQMLATVPDMTPYILAVLTLLVGALGFLFTVVWQQLVDRLNHLENNQIKIEEKQRADNIGLYGKMDAIDKNITNWRIEMIKGYVEKVDCEKKRSSCNKKQKEGG